MLSDGIEFEQIAQNAAVTVGRLYGVRFAPDAGTRLVAAATQYWGPLSERVADAPERHLFALACVILAAAALDGRRSARGADPVIRNEDVEEAASTCCPFYGLECKPWRKAGGRPGTS